MFNLAAAALAFILMRRLISGGPARAALVRRLGEPLYRGLFALLSLVVLGWMIAAYGAARTPGAGAPAWGASPAAHVALAVAQLIAVVLVVGGVTTRNPTIAGLEARLAEPGGGGAQGLVRITRHPFLWGVALFSAAHLAVRHDAASLVLFGALILVALTGTVSIDAKRARTHGADWTRFRDATSNLPFAAILQGRQHLSLREIGALRLLAGVAVWAALLWAHPHVSGGVRVVP